jgi:VanZ family protein
MYTFPFVPFRFSKTATIGILIVVLCLIPSEEFSRLKVPITFGDVIVHFIMFFAFSSALCFDLMKKRQKPLNKRSLMLTTLLVSILLGILTELLQHFITPLHRTGSYTDLLFDFFGTVTGILFMTSIGRKFVSVP